MPASPRARLASDNQTQINALFAFAEFPLGHFVESSAHRGADYKYLDPNDPRKRKRRGMAFLNHEKLTVVEPPIDTAVTYDETPPQANALGVTPTTRSSHAGWIANWNEFAAEGAPSLKTLDPTRQSYVEMELPGGRLSSTFRCDDQHMTRAEFLYGENPERRFYAHEATVTLEYPEDAATFTLRSQPFGNGAPLDLVFTWGDQDEFEILVGNGSAMSLENVRSQTFCGQDHESLTDFEFEVLHDVVNCQRDGHQRLPVPKVFAQEIRQIPCIVSTISSSTAADNVAAAPQPVQNRARLTPAPAPASEPSPPLRLRALEAFDILEESIIVNTQNAIFDQARAANRMCRFILRGNETFATGFLIGPDLVMTAAHVFFNPDGTLIEPMRAAQMRVAFEQFEIQATTIAIRSAVEYRLMTDWLVDPFLQRGTANRDVGLLDYAVVRLAGSVGTNKIGSDERGYFAWPPNPASLPVLREDTLVRTLQYSADGSGTLKSALGVVRTVARNRLRIGYTASTTDGASGGAVTDQDFNLVALHVAGSDENFPRQNQCLPVRWILRDLVDRNVTELLQRPPEIEDGTGASGPATEVV